jgi:hypothetical protein
MKEFLQHMRDVVVSILLAILAGVAAAALVEAITILYRLCTP